LQELTPVARSPDFDDGRRGMQKPTEGRFSLLSLTLFPVYNIKNAEIGSSPYPGLGFLPLEREEDKDP
jgi:hypothetical protein